MAADDQTKRDGNVVLNESFLEVRAKLLEVAATFDRMDRGAAGQPLDVDATAKRERLVQAIRIILDDSDNRAERLQHLFSREYESNWRDQMGIPTT